MIRRLRGTLIEAEITQVVIDAGGVGYGVAVSPQTSAGLTGLGETVDLWIHTNVYEGGIDLYGFESGDDRDVFLRLTGVSGIGPRLAMNILSGPGWCVSPALGSARPSAWWWSSKTSSRICCWPRERRLAPTKPGPPESPWRRCALRC